ncbi:MAG: GNAT family N-acetyltransferase [Streptosporangiaceae bacterium]
MAGIEIRELRELHDLEQVCGLFDRIWTFEPGAIAILREIMRGYACHGNYVVGAYRDGRLVGASVANFGSPRSHELQSYITGAVLGEGVGLALKRHQRLWALEHGIERITWTFDPLVSRNAHFNLVKLGARAERYLESHYGLMPDAINAGDESDRLLAVWHLRGPDAVAAARNDPVVVTVPPDAEPYLLLEGGRPVLTCTEARTVLIQVPADIEQLRRTDADKAQEWRKAVRESIGRLIADGGTVLGFHAKSSYVIRRK